VNESTLSNLPVVVIGAGPIGLAAAAHLVRRDLPFVLLEAGDGPGATLERVRHVRFFSEWRYDVDGAARALLETAGHHLPAPDRLPTAGEIIDDYLRPLAAHDAIAPHVRFRHRVLSLTRHGVDKAKSAGRDALPYVVRVLSPDGEDELLARSVLDASGTFGNPNPLGANGLRAIGEAGLAQHVAYGMPDVLGRDRARYEGKHVVVVGAGHSAMGNLLALAELASEAPGTRIGWILRGADTKSVYGGGEADGFAARGAIGARLDELVRLGRVEVHAAFRIHALRATADGVDIVEEPRGDHSRRIHGVDRIIASTGSRPDLEMTRELRLGLDPILESTEALAPLIDPNVHSCGTVRPHGHRELAHPDRGYYAVGARSYGRAPSFLLATGYEQVRSVVAALAGDLVAADDVQLELPATGVCSVGTEASSECCAPAPSKAEPAKAELAKAEPTVVEAGCCGGPAASGSDACCVRDADAKAAGEEGCGCATASSTATVPVASSACCG
jgi:hypothetical protein